MNSTTKKTTIGLVLTFAFALAVGAGLAYAAPPFELDGNATSNDFPGDDWDTVNTGGGTPLARTGLIVDRPEPSAAQFLGGGSKDEQDIPNWNHRGGTPPSKDDITNAYAAAYQNADNGHLVLVFGMDRFDTSGDAQLGFWFLQDNVQPVVGGPLGGTFSGVHIDGDILVLVNFSGGGDTPTIEVFEWQGAGPVSLGAGADVLCTGGFIPTNQSFCGITNSATATAPWTYFNKDVNQGNTATNFPPGAFFEGAIDLTALDIAGCFTQFLAESRSSTSITATLKDFATPAGGFNLCAIEATKTCTNPRLNEAEDRIIYDISGKVRNIGFGQVFNIALSDSPPADGVFQRVNCTDPSTVLGTFPFAGPLAAGGEVCYKNTITVTLEQNGTDDTVTATANTESDGTGVVLTDSATADCPNLQINPALRISKDCTSSVALINSQVVAQVTVTGTVCNIGDTRLDNVTVVDNKAGTLLTGVSLVAPDDPTDPEATPGACVDYSDTYIPNEANDAAGNPTTDPSAVVFKDTATATADDIFGDPVLPPQSDMASCPLCPEAGTNP
jgi:hypothetical protein